MSTAVAFDAALRGLSALDPASVIRPRFRGRTWTVPVSSLKSYDFHNAVMTGDLASALVLMVGFPDAQALIGTARLGERFGDFAEEFVTACVAVAPDVQTTEVTGWRYWAIFPTKSGVTLLSPFHNKIARFPFTEVERGPLLPRARCWWNAEHSAPTPGCQCGWRVVRDRNELALWMYGRRLWERFTDLPFILVKVRSRGRVLPWEPLIDPEVLPGERGDEARDPATTYRAERIEITGPAVLSPTVPRAIPRAVEHRRRQFGCQTEPIPDEPPREFLARLAAEGTG